jgi:endonuclease/exonuclease/phosphatase family metal-dependent hydrolase
MTLRVLTLNIWNTDGPWADRLPRIREWIARLEPDVIGLQEVVRGPDIDQLTALAPAGFATAYARAIDFWRDPRAGFGNAVLSRWPIRAQESAPLPDAGDEERRVVLATTIDAPFGPLTVLCTHLNWRLHHGWVREKQVRALGEILLRRRAREGFPPLLLGDFNAEPDSTEIRYVKGLHSLEGRSLYLRDAWGEAGDGGRGITWSNRNPHARTALEPDRRIDYVFVGAPLRNRLGQLERCRVVCDDEREGIWPSDHFGVYAELRTRGSP